MLAVNEMGIATSADLQWTTSRAAGKLARHFSNSYRDKTWQWLRSPALTLHVGVIVRGNCLKKNNSHNVGGV